jgi:hypothetical protein
LEYRIQRPAVLFQDRVAQDAGEADRFGQRESLVELNKPENQPDHEDNADNPEDIVHSRSPHAVAPQILRIILFLLLERRVRCSKGDTPRDST